ncbi:MULTISPECIES: serine hydrolase domain-containing protein [Rhodanobacter]|uniref:Beta-lactamase family protein n=1 Tax=Rhodanobacter hydrolyticus TaxID=2250595 RepID=A0ABW8J9D7_9GAMM|nr:serine hydrolase domain-containing protein [Rhodanobacter sp. 7MK24]MBD8880624.1 beta-lactamase family protein [Rhodanobacter sp. 7MK24]
MMRICLLALLLFAAPLMAREPGALPAGSAIDRQVEKLMEHTGARGVAIAVIDRGKVIYIKAYGDRNAKGDPLRTDTVMYGASLTKTVFAYTVMRLVDQHRIDLDTPVAAYLDKPLPAYDTEAIYRDKYGPYKDLADDERWKKITPRMVLTHSTGFLNFYWLEPDHKLRIHFEPGSHFSYSGEGMILLQFAIENGRKSQHLGVDVGDLVQENVFEPLDMKRSSLMWRADFAGNLADGWNDKGEPQPHDRRSKVRAAGSMDTTIDDLSKFAAALVSGKGLSPASRMEMVKPQLHIGTRTQFPTVQKDLPVDQQRKDLYAGLGVVVFDGPQGHGFFKGGHDEQTGNTLVCIEAHERCVLILANDVRAEAGFADLVRFILGDTGVPYEWEYGDQAGKSN